MAALHMSWALNESGCVRERTSLEGMQEVMQGWAPELVAATSAIQEGQCWLVACGSCRPLKGLMLGH